MNIAQQRYNVSIRVHDVDVLRYLYPEWDALEKEEKLQLVKSTGKTSLRRIQVHNKTTDALHKYLAKNINPEKSDSDDGNKMHFGDDDSSFNSSDTALNNKVGESGLTDTTYDSSAKETTFTTFLDSTELNGETLKEIGLVSGNGNLWNHAAISPTIDKTNTETVVADIAISFSN